MSPTLSIDSWHMSELPDMLAPPAQPAAAGRTSALLRMLALALAIALCPAARAQTGPLIAELVEYEDVRRVIPADTAERLARVVALTPVQSDTATDLVSAARNDLARVVNRHLRTVRDDPTYEQIRESEQRVVQDAAEVERRLLTDLLELLTPDQAAAFPRFERSHRRTLLAGRSGLPLPMDIFAYLRQNKIDFASDAQLSGMLDRFDIDQDAAFVRERRALIAYYRSVRLGFDGSPESKKRDRDTQNEFFASTAKLRQVQSAFIQKLIVALPVEQGDALVLEIMQRNAEGFDASSARPDQAPVVREIRAMDLLPEQKARLQSVVANAWRDMLILARRCVIDQAAYELMDNEARSKVPTAPTNVFWGKASDLRKIVARELLAMLTPEQRSNYDASPVLDPSETSRVKDEP